MRGPCLYTDNLYGVPFMKVAQLPIDTMQMVMNTLAECPYKIVAPAIAAAQAQMMLGEMPDATPGAAVPQESAANQN